MPLLTHSQYFDRLVDLIPARYYLADEDAEHVNLKYLKKDARAEAKAKFKQEYKKNKLSKLDPDAPKSTLEIQQAKEAVAAQSSDESADDMDADDDGEEDSDIMSDFDAEEMQSADSDGASDEELDDEKEQHRQNHPAAAKKESGPPVSREELKERLQKKLEILRQQRKADEAAEKAKKAKEWRDDALKKGRESAAKKRKQPNDSQQQQRVKAKTQPIEAEVPPAVVKQQDHPSKKPSKEASQKSQAGGLTFTKVDFGEGAASLGGKNRSLNKKKKASKAELLEDAEKKKAELQQAEGTEEGRAKVLKQGWGNALARAQGEKIFDDPKLLKKSMKKEQKIKEKKTKAWKERMDKQEELRSSRQQKRTDNIQGRIQAKKEKKIKKRENKLLRAGFEGRKSGFIETPKRP